MMSEEKSQLDALCKQIAVEQDPETFHQLLIRLNDLLERKERRLESKPGQTVI
jgi:hypothetical protein